MKKAAIILALLIPSALLPVPRLYFKIYPPEIKKTGVNSYNVTCSVGYDGVKKEFFEDSGVPLSTELITITGPVEDYTLKERDFLFSQINFDFNNDGDLGDTYRLSFFNNKFLINNTVVYPVSSSRTFQGMPVFTYQKGHGAPFINRIGKNGLPFIIYAIDFKNRSLSVGFGGDIVIETFPNPCIQFMVVKCSDNTSPAEFSISGIKNHKTLINEKIHQGDEGLLKDAVWGVKKIDINTNKKSDFAVSLKAAPPFALLLYVHMSIEKGSRLRTMPMTALVKE